MGFPPITIVWGLVGALTVAVLVCVSAAAFAWRAAWPAGLRRLANDCRERVDAMEIEWAKTKGQLAADVEALEQLEESVERKRARAAASASKAAASAGVMPPNGTSGDARAQLRALARSKGYNV